MAPVSPRSIAICITCALVSGVCAFQSVTIPSIRRSPHHTTPINGKEWSSSDRMSSTSLNMFMGSDGGLLGVGGPEIFTILLVGYFVLGPSDLYKLVKEIGKFIQNIRTLGTDLSTTFESNMESQLELEELRKAQRDLTDAFSFRRSINVDDTEAFATTTTTPRAEEVAGAGATAAVASEAAAASGTPKKKKRVRVKKKIQPEVPAPSEITSAAEPATSNIPDLEMPSTGDPFVGDTASSMTKEEEEEINKEFEKYVNMGSESEKNGKMEMASLSPEEETASQTRFQQQMSSDWNKQIMDNEDKLSPLAKVMEMLAVLEKEKISKSKLLEEEYRKRAEMDQEYYEKQRKILEDAAAEVQKDVYKIP